MLPRSRANCRWSNGSTSVEAAGGEEELDEPTLGVGAQFAAHAQLVLLQQAGRGTSLQAAQRFLIHADGFVPAPQLHQQAGQVSMRRGLQVVDLRGPEPMLGSRIRLTPRVGLQARVESPAPGGLAFRLDVQFVRGVDAFGLHEPAVGVAVVPEPGPRYAGEEVVDGVARIGFDALQCLRERGLLLPVDVEVEGRGLGKPGLGGRYSRRVDDPGGRP